MPLHLLVQFVVLMVVICGIIIFFLHQALVKSTDGAVKRLNDEIEKTTRKQSELNRKLKEADEELEKRKAEARALTEKMQSEVEEEAKVERDKIVGKAREESEDIIAKAQGAKEKIKKELEKENDLRMIDYSMKILNEILSSKSRGALDETMIVEYMDSLQTMDMTRIGPEVKVVDVITFNPLSTEIKGKLSKIIESKLGRALTFKEAQDDKLGGGIILKFGSMALDGSIKFRIQEFAGTMKNDIESRIG